MDDDLIEKCARAAHEVNRAYCAALGDLSQPAWEDAPHWQQNSARMGARAVLEGGKDHTPGKSHEGWLAQKREEGWKYGPVKDPEKKEHPCFVPFDQLPVDQQAKDHIFIAVVRQVAKVLV